MNHAILDRVALWEAIALIELLQAHARLTSRPVSPMRLLPSADPDLRTLLEAAGIPVTTNPQPDEHRWMFGDTYRAIELDTENHSYQEILARENARICESPAFAEELASLRTVGLEPIQLCGVCDVPSPNRPYMVLAPFALRADLEVPTEESRDPERLWRNVTYMLRMMLQGDEELYLLGRPGERLKTAQYAEAHIASGWPLLEKLSLLAHANRVVSCLNEWMALAAGLRRKMAYCYPNDYPKRRWMMHRDPQFVRLPFDHKIPQPAITISYLRVWSQMP